MRILGMKVTGKRLPFREKDLAKLASGDCNETQQRQWLALVAQRQMARVTP